MPKKNRKKIIFYLSIIYSFFKKGNKKKNSMDIDTKTPSSKVEKMDTTSNVKTDEDGWTFSISSLLEDETKNETSSIPQIKPKSKQKQVPKAIRKRKEKSIIKGESQIQKLAKRISKKESKKEFKERWKGLY